MDVTEFTLEDLKAVLRAVAGEGDGIDLDTDILDVSFGDLGYDSLALLETAARIEQERGILFPDSTFTDAPHPRALLAAVNEHLTASSAA